MMKIPSFRPTRPFVFSLFVVSILASKLLHLFQHASSIGFLRFIVYFPTFFIPDVLAGIIHRLLLHDGEAKVWPWISLCIGTFMAIVSLIAAASQLGFYYVTGSEMQWDAASSIAADETAVKFMMTGIVQVMVSGALLLLGSFLTSPVLYNWTGDGLAAVWKFITPASWRKKDPCLPTARVRVDRLQPNTLPIRPLFYGAFVLSTLILQSVRPSQPYNHISATLPFALLRIFHHPHPDTCSMMLYGEAFPLADVIAEKHWEKPHGNFKGWAPSIDNDLVNQYKKYRPSWLPNELPSGFYRWSAKNKNLAPSKTKGKDKDDIVSGCRNAGHHYYNPVSDPLRITNLDTDIYLPLKQAFENNSVLVSHVIMISMESGRKELFPLREGTNFHQTLLDTHITEEAKENASDVLSKLTPVAQQVTGEPYWADATRDSEIEPGQWKDSAAPGMGGLNVKGAVTGSTLSFKSFLSSHCGVYPLPVDFLEETTTEYYQPCFPQILKLFNQVKDGGKLDKRRDAPVDDHRANVQRQKWKNVYIQTTTDNYDRQGIMNDQMGFEETTYKETFKNSSSKYYPPKSEELNYFGYPDTDAKPVFRDAIFDAAQNGTRLFLSHFTSATHHPWNVPDGFLSQRYAGSGHPYMNSYLNTINYIDGWLGDILGLLDEAGIANETLVVFVGDHGQAFKEDTKMTGTYNNPHISNFRVPIVFRHPHLPRINIKANATSMSILPTILDLLVQSNSLSPHDTTIAADLVHEYEGQSLLRPLKSSHNGRRAWNIGIINSGGSMLSVTSASNRWRAIVPMEVEWTYRFSDLETDPYELDVMEEWTLDDMLSAVGEKHGEDAVAWLRDADAVTKWWIKEMHRRWNYEGKE